MRKAVIYARFSCSKQREASIEDQLRECREWCDRNGYAVVAEYADHAISGKTDARPEFQRMVENAGESDVCVVYMMDRFSRDMYDAPLYKKELAKKGVRVVSARESVPDGPEGMLMEKVLEGMAAAESARTSIRTRRGMHGNAEKCMHNGVQVFGYSIGEDGRYIVDERQAAVVREVFERRASRETCNSIARDLAARGLKTSFGNPVAYTFVYNMLRNAKYKGVYSFGDVTVPDGMPRIVDDQLWESVQHVIGKKQRKEEVWMDYPLTGKLMCGKCNSPMRGVSAHGRGGKRYRYYECRSHCLSNMRADALEGEAVAAVRALLDDRDAALEVARVVADQVKDEKKNDARRAEAEKSLREARDGVKNLMKALECGRAADLIGARIEELREQEERAAATLAMLDTLPSVDVDDFADFLQLGRGLDDADVLDAFVAKAALFEDELLLVLNLFKNKCEPISLSIPIRTNCVWLPLNENIRIAWSDGLWLLRVAA